MVSQTQQLYTHAAQPRAVQQRKAKVGARGRRGTAPRSPRDTRGGLVLGSRDASRLWPGLLAGWLRWGRVRWCSRRCGSNIARMQSASHSPPPQYREDEEQQQVQQQGQEGGGAVPQQTLLLNPANIMFDRRVVRGSTYRPVMPQQMPTTSSTANSSSQ
jgi:hypothetical protein